MNRSTTNKRTEYNKKEGYRLEKGPSEVTVILLLSRVMVTASPKAPALPPATLMRSWRNFSSEAMSMILSSTGFAQSITKLEPFFFPPFAAAAAPRLIFLSTLSFPRYCCKFRVRVSEWRRERDGRSWLVFIAISFGEIRGSIIRS